MMRNWVVCSFLFLLAFSVYMYGAYPSVSVGDSGEFIAASDTLGVPHAPGYPTYVLLAKVFQQTLHFGNIGYRANLFSAACAALAVVGLFILGIELGLGGAISLGGALLFMLGPAQVTNAQASEVFALHALLCVGVLIAAVCNAWFCAAFIAGLGMGNHQTLLFVLSGLAFLYFSKPKSERPDLMRFALSFAAGLSIYALLFFRAGAEPLLNSGHPDSLSRLWRVFTRADYGSLTLALGDAPARNAQSMYLQLHRFGAGLREQVSWIGVALGCIGMGWVLWKRHAAGIAIAAAFILIGPFFFVLGNLPFDAQSAGLLERFYIVPGLLWVILSAFGVNVLGRQRPSAGLAFLVISGLLWHTRAEAFPLRYDYRAYSYGMNTLHTLPPHSTLLIDGGDDTFYTLAYLTQVEHRRPDVTLHDRGGVVFPGFYGDDFRQLTREEKEQRRAHVEHARAVENSRMWYSTMNERILPMPIYQQQGILYGPVPNMHMDIWELYDLRDILPWMNAQSRAARDYRTRALLPYYAYQRGVLAARKELWDEAVRWSIAAHASGPDVIWLLPNLIQNGYEWAQKNFQAGRIDTAERLYRLITQWNPKDPIAWADLGAIEERRGRLDLAIERYQTAIQIDPASEQAHYNLAVAYWKRSEWVKVEAEFHRVLDINPQNAAARNYWMQVQQKLQNQKS